MKSAWKLGFWLLVAASPLTGCSGTGQVEKKLDAFLVKSCDGQFPCQVNLRGVTPFTWDRLYAFKYVATRAEIEHAIGRKLSNYQELKRYLIFTRAGEIVHSEDEPTDVEHPIKGELVFSMPDTVTYRSYSVDTTFKVTQESSEAGSFFLLEPVK